MPSFTLTSSLRETLARRIFTFKTVSAWQIIPPAANLPFAQGAYQTAVAPVGHITARTTRTWTLAHIAPGWTLCFRCGAGKVVH